MEVAKTLLRNRAVLRCHCERLLRGIRQTTSSSICSNSELELKTSTIRHSDSHHHVTRSSSCDSKLTPNRSYFYSLLYTTSHVLDPGGAGDVRRGVLRAAPAPPVCVNFCFYYLLQWWPGGSIINWRVSVIKTNLLHVGVCFVRT